MGSGVHPGKIFFTDFACKFDTGILVGDSYGIFDKIPERFFEDVTLSWQFSFQNFFATMVIEQSLDWRICGW